MSEPPPRQPARSLHAAKPNSQLRFGIAREAHASAVGPFTWPKPPIVALNAAFTDPKCRRGFPIWVPAVLVFEPSAYCRRQSARTGPRRGEYDNAGGDFSTADGSHLSGV